jgi:sugar lactone lactonase YvrE
LTKLECPFQNSLPCFLLLTIFGLGLQLILLNHIATADPWDVEFSNKWGSACLLSANIGCISPLSQDPLSQDPLSQDPLSQDPLSQTVEPDKIGDGMFWGIWGIATDGSSIYTADVLNHRIQKFDLNGNFITKWGKEGIGNGEFNRPSGIATDSQYVYVVDHNDRIQVFDKAGQFVSSIGSGGSDPGQLNSPEDIEVDSDGHIYIADSGNNRIQIFYPNNLGGIVWGSKGTGPGQFDYPQGISVPAPGHVYVADSHNNRIQYFQLSNNCPQGTTEVQTGVCFVKEWGESGSSDGQFKRPADISTSNEIIYVVDANNNRIQLFTKDGTFIKKFGSECLIKTGLKPTNGCKEPEDGSLLDRGDGQFKYPSGVTVISDSIFIADNFNDRVQVFRIEPGPLPAMTPNVDPAQAQLSVIKADAGQDQTVDSGQQVTLSGENSMPNDGSLEFQWNQVGGGQSIDLMNADSIKAEFDTSQINENTKLRFELRVTDRNNQANIDTDTVDVNVVGEKENQKPKANAGSDRTVYEGQSAEIDGTGSQDEDGTIDSYDWKSNDCGNEPKGDIQNSKQAKATFVAPQISTSSTSCEVELKVTDNKGDIDSDTITITVQEKLISNPNPNQGNVVTNPNLKLSQ